MLPIGNKNIAARVAAFAAGKIPHAIMLEGERGLGKHTLAAHIASLAVCSGNTPPCGQCRSCHLCSVGSHPDVVMISPQGKQIKIDQIRDLRQKAYLKASMGERKVYIIESAENMNEASQNAFLKVLEEPPAGVIFILLAKSADSLLPTVRSRCIILSLVPPKKEEAAEYLAKTTNHTAAEIDNALSAVKCNIGLALEVLSGKRAQGFSGLARELIADINGASSYEMLKKLRPYEKDRVAIDAILNELQERIAVLIREGSYTHIKEGLTRAELIKAYEIIAELKVKAASNVNTMLLFANLCSALKSL